MHNTQPAGAAIGGLAKYVMIVGQGRSGTNWLLDILDQSPRTHCRNEPNEIASSPLADLPDPSVPLADPSVLEREWDEAVRWTAAHMGERDHSIPGRKQHVNELGRRLGMARTINRRPRRILSSVIASLRAGEWEMPGWVGRQSALEAALPVLKFVQIPTWCAWALEHRPAARVLHIVRHPGGFLNSWKNRWLKVNEADQVRQANRDRLDAIRRAQPIWAGRFGDIDAMSVAESELWYWRYAAETIHLAGQGKRQYELVVYEDLVSDTLGIARRAFDHCGLEWNDRIAQRIAASGSESGSIAAAWQSKLSPQDVESVNRVMNGSIMQGWWA